MATAAQAAASRANGALSHGPTSEEGTATSSLNALKTGLTGRTVLLPSEDAALYEAHLAQFREQYQPVGDQELALVQSLADTWWRIARIPSLEMGIYALGRLEFADLFPDHEEGARKILIDAKVFLAYRRQLVSLGIQEGRLRRQAEKALAALKALQQPRIQASQASLNEAAKLYINAVRSGRQQEYDPEALGFEFTIEQIELRALDLQPDLFHDWACRTAEPVSCGAALQVGQALPPAKIASLLWPAAFAEVAPAALPPVLLRQPSRQMPFLSIWRHAIISCDGRLRRAGPPAQSGAEVCYRDHRRRARLDSQL